MGTRRRLRPLQASELAERLAGRRLVFTVTTGRSGTALLAHLLALHRGVVARHEPKPTFSSALRSVLARPGVATEFWLAHKLPAIVATRGHVYAETSHLACKGFLESLVDLGVRPELVVLARRPREVVRSLCALGTIPGRTYGGVKYYLSPADPVVLPLERSRWERFSDYQLCYWYCLEIEARARRYETRWTPLGVRFHHVQLESLASPAGVSSLTRALDLAPIGPIARLRAARLVAAPVNSRPDKKRSAVLPADDELERQERAVRLALEDAGAALVGE
jgi:hypothetical protein